MSSLKNSVVIGGLNLHFVQKGHESLTHVLFALTNFILVSQIMAGFEIVSCCLSLLIVNVKF